MADTTSSRKHTCLFRVGFTKPGEHECILLDQGKSVTLGRAETCDVVLTESCGVSRKHCVLQKTDDVEWTVTDLKSGNGVYVNGCRIPASTPQTLRDRDLLEIGREATAPAYRFQYYRHARILLQDHSANITRKKTGIKRPSAACASPTSLIRDKIRQREKWLKHEMELKLAEKENAFSGLMSEVQVLRERLEGEVAAQRCRDDALTTQRQEHESRLAQLRRQHSETETQLVAALREQSSGRQTLEDQLARVRGEQQQLEDELETERKKHEEERASLQDLLTVQFSRREETYRQKIEEKERDMLSEKSKLEQALATELSEKAELSSSIASLRTEQARYWEVVREAESNAEALASVEHDTKTKIVASFEDLVESELVCAICSELFVQATSLGCAHSFCQLCIEKWMERKKECPNCRQKIKSHVRSIVLDNYIDRLMDMVSEDMRTHRVKVVQDRKGEQDAFDKQKAEEKLRRQQARATMETQRAANQGAPHPQRPANRLQDQLDAVTRHFQDVANHQQVHRLHATNHRAAAANNHHGYRGSNHHHHHHHHHQQQQQQQQSSAEPLFNHAQAFNHLNARYMEEYRSFNQPGNYGYQPYGMH